MGFSKKKHFFVKLISSGGNKNFNERKMEKIGIKVHL